MFLDLTRKDNTMDEFKQELTKQCDVGGLKCSCCNPTKGSKFYKKKRFRKTARTRMKRKLKKEMENS